jgi:hypothetical protein
MATEKAVGKDKVVIVLRRQEAVDLIGLLTAQLAGLPLKGNMAGACPDIIVRRAEGPSTLVSFAVEGLIEPSR